MKKLLFFALIVSLLYIASCSQKEPVLPPLPPVTYSQQNSENIDSESIEDVKIIKSEEVDLTDEMFADYEEFFNFLQGKWCATGNKQEQTLEIEESNVTFTIKSLENEIEKTYEGLLKDLPDIYYFDDSGQMITIKIVKVTENTITVDDPESNNKLIYVRINNGGK
jgi:flagellar motility protein MotE (MotC chaperone)